MRTSLRAVGAGALLSAVTALSALAADHREAPFVNEFPPADLNDIYVFRAPGAPARLVLVMTVNPISDPDFAASYAFSPRVLYRFEIDNTGDAVPEHTIDFIFTPFAGGPQTVTARIQDSAQTRGLAFRGQTTAPTVVSGTPNEPTIIRPREGSPVRLFAGPRDDPFFFDAVGLARFRAGDPDPFRGEDSFAGFNVSAIVIELPVALISDGRRQLQISGFTIERTPTGLGRIIDRTGVPAVSTVFIPLPQRDAFNRTRPEDDAERWGDVIVATLNSLGTPQQNIDILASVAVPDTLKVNLDAPLRFPNGRRLQDDVIDTLLQLVLDDPAATDGVDRNDRAFSNTFPYLGPPQQAR